MRGRDPGSFWRQSSSIQGYLDTGFWQSATTCQSCRTPAGRADVPLARRNPAAVVSSICVAWCVRRGTRVVSKKKRSELEFAKASHRDPEVRTWREEPSRTLTPRSAATKRGNVPDPLMPTEATEPLDQTFSFQYPFRGVLWTFCLPKRRSLHGSHTESFAKL